MNQAVEEWLERQTDRAIARQRASVDTAKLLTTFTTGISATIVGTALQVGDSPSPFDNISAGTLGVAFALTVLTILLDRLTDANYEYVIAMASALSWTPEETLARLRQSTLTAEYFNRSVVVAVWRCSAAQVLVSASASVVAAFSLLVVSA